MNKIHLKLSKIKLVSSSVVAVVFRQDFLYVALASLKLAL